MYRTHALPFLRMFAPALGLLSACASSQTSDGQPMPDDRCGSAEETIATPPLHTPRWAFLPWISKDISTTQDTYDFVDGFRSRDIPVGTVVLDSPWETNYNTYIPNPTRYPNFAQLVNDMHARNVRIVLWTTPLINSSSFDLEVGGDNYAGPAEDYQPALDCNFFVNENESYVWWKGTGSAIDFYNGKARGFWHRQQNNALDQGIDGWKLDFGESYIATEPLTTAAGTKTLQEYSEEYYRDYLAYGVSRRGRDFLTMVRAYDISYQYEGRFFARKEAAPVAWMGDNRRDFIGLVDALDEMFISARAGYTVLGSDIGGYLDVDDKDVTGPHIPFDSEVFLRWTALGAMTPFMQLHGRANLTPWTVPDRVDETVAAYRFWSKLHEQLVPLFYSLSEEAQPKGQAMLFPQGDDKSWAGDYRYLIGEALLVAPLLDGTGRRDVNLPAGARWLDFFDMSMVYAGGTKVASYDARDPQKLPIFLREGAIVPLEVHDDSTKLGSADSANGLTLLAFPGASASSFRLHDADDMITDVSAQTSGHTTEVMLSRAPRKVFLRLRLDELATAVTANGTPLAMAATYDALASMPSGYAIDAPHHMVFVKLQPATGALHVEISTGP